MGVYKYEENIAPHTAAQAGELPELPAQKEWAVGVDTVLAIKAGGAGDLYVVDDGGRILVEFDAADNDQVHAAARWIATFIKSIES